MVRVLTDPGRAGPASPTDARCRGGSRRLARRLASSSADGLRNRVPGREQLRSVGWNGSSATWLRTTSPADLRPALVRGATGSPASSFRGRRRDRETPCRTPGRTAPDDGCSRTSRRPATPDRRRRRSDRPAAAGGPEVVDRMQNPLRAALHRQALDGRGVVAQRLRVHQPDGVHARLAIDVGTAPAKIQVRRRDLVAPRSAAARTWRRGPRRTSVESRRSVRRNGRAERTPLRPAKMRGRGAERVGSRARERSADRPHRDPRT